MSNLVILPIRAGLKMTMDCVKSIRKQDIPITLMCIDNATDDGCAPWIRGNSDLVVTYPRPAGLSYVWNQALELAFREYKLPYVLIPNNDTILRPDTYRCLIEDGGDFVTGIGVSTKDQIATTDVSNKRNHPDFSCMLIRRSVWEKIGGFDESMMIYVSDCDYHIRMHQAGVNAYCIGMPFFHIASGTIKTLDGKEREGIQKQADADRERFKEKWGMMPGTPEYEALFHEAIQK